jgi:hypothetical protein
MPTFPVDQVASVAAPSGSNPRARPFSQSTTAFMPSVSFGSPEVGQPSDPPVPILSAKTTA